MADPDEWDQESGQLDAADTLDDRNVADPLDEGILPARAAVDRRRVGRHRPRDRRRATALDRYLARELPDFVPDDGDGIGDTADTDGEPWDDEVGELRAGRLVAADRGETADSTTSCGPATSASTAQAASAEEAAMHVVGDRKPDDD